MRKNKKEINRKKKNVKNERQLFGTLNVKRKQEY